MLGQGARSISKGVVLVIKRFHWESDILVDPAAPSVGQEGERGLKWRKSRSRACRCRNKMASDEEAVGKPSENDSWGVAANSLRLKCN